LLRKAGEPLAQVAERTDTRTTAHLRHVVGVSAPQALSPEDSRKSSNHHDSEEKESRGRTEQAHEVRTSSGTEVRRRPQHGESFLAGCASQPIPGDCLPV